MSRSSSSGGDTTSGEAVQEAWRRFAELNQRFFQGQLRLEGLSFNPRFRGTLGSCAIDGRGRAIQLSPFYLRLFGWAELEKVLLHEMVHLRLGGTGHSLEFRRLEKALEREYGPLQPRPIPAQAHNYIYFCDRCHLEFGRWRPLAGAYSHRGCGGRLWRKHGKPGSKIYS